MNNIKQFQADTKPVVPKEALETIDKLRTPIKTNFGFAILRITTTILFIIVGSLLLSGHNAWDMANIFAMPSIIKYVGRTTISYILFSMYFFPNLNTASKRDDECIKLDDKLNNIVENASGKMLELESVVAEYNFAKKKSILDTIYLKKHLNGKIDAEDLQIARDNMDNLVKVHNFKRLYKDITVNELTSGVSLDADGNEAIDIANIVFSNLGMRTVITIGIMILLTGIIVPEETVWTLQMIVDTLVTSVVGVYMIITAITMVSKVLPIIRYNKQRQINLLNTFLQIIETRPKV